MKLRPTIPGLAGLPIEYPSNEETVLASLDRLFIDWREQFANNRQMLMKHDPDEMVCDGFYPHYFSQNKRVLYIGWESRENGGGHQMDLLEAYRTGKWIGDQHIDINRFHRRMIKIGWAITHRRSDGGFSTWDAIPKASQIGDSIGEPRGLSFAFMNISKFSNEERRAADWEVINAAIALSSRPRDFIQEEVAILKPEIIIVMNLDNTPFDLGSFGSATKIHQSDDVMSCLIDAGPHRSLLIHTWHFSSSKEEVECFYDPICDAVRRSESQID